MRKKGYQILVSAILAVSLLTGCAGRAGKSAGEEEKKPDEAKAMGRYMEKSLELPGEIIGTNNLCKTKEGLWILCGESSPAAWLLKKGSDTWEEKKIPESLRAAYVTNTAVSENGELAFCSFDYEKEENPYTIWLVDRQGELKKINQGKDSLNDMIFGTDNKLYVQKSGAGAGCYRYSAEDGSEEKLFSSSTVVEKLTFSGNRLLALDVSEVLIYDLEKGLLEEGDAVLNEFCRNNLLGFGVYSGVHPAVIFTSEEENVVYLSYSGGLYRHTLYGNVMEQVIDGKLSSFGDPSKMQQGVTAEKQQDGSVSFKVLFYGKQLIQFNYDASMPTVPDIRLKVYGLQDSMAVHQAIALFQTKYPECYVEYEAGLTGVGAANTDDELKNLNTALLSGEGPDVIVMDGLDEEIYSSKGILEDLSSLVDSINEEEKLLPNVVEAMRREGGLYSIPARFSIPMVAGEADYLSDETDMNGLALAAEQLRKNYPKKVLMGSALPESVLVMLAQTESWRWIEDGKLQEEVLEKYLGCAERIYQAETAGVTEEEIQEEREELESAGYFSSIEMNGQVKKKYYSLSSSMVSVLIKEQRMALGYVNSASDLCWADQLGEDYVIKPITDELGIGFRPVMRLAVNSQSKQKEMAEKFVKLVLSSEFQSMNLGDGAPVNIAALEKSMEEQTGFNRALYGTDADGNSVSVYALWPSKETLEVYIDSIEKMNHSLGYNQFLADAVGKIGKKMLEEGNISKGDAVNEIRKKAAIFLAE